MLESVTCLYGQGFLTPVPSIYPLSPQKLRTSWAPVVHTYNHSYSDGRDQEDHGLKPDQANNLWDHILEKRPFTNPVLQINELINKKRKKEHSNKWAQLLSRSQAVAITPIPYTQKNPQANKNLCSSRQIQMCLVFPLYFTGFLNFPKVHSGKTNPLNENANNLLMQRLKWYRACLAIMRHWVQTTAPQRKKIVTVEILPRQRNPRKHTWLNSTIFSVPITLTCLSSVNLKQGKAHTSDIPIFCLKNFTLIGQKKQNS
jgi:hypothetical protein